MLLPIVTVPSPILRKKAEDVTAVTDEIRTFLDDMVETMYHGSGAGLAAPQVGKSWRIFTMDMSEDKTRPYKIINPVITWVSEEMVSIKEGCLSFPGQYIDVERPERVKIKYLDETGTEREEEFSGMEARCIQHEIDHLDGKLFIDSLSKSKQRLIIERSTRFKG